MSKQETEKNEQRSRLTTQRSTVDYRRFKWTSKTFWGYGVGHVQSDLVATMWFSYLLVCLQEVVGLSKLYAGFLLTIGQLTDGIATPLVGIGLDKVGLCGSRYGKRKSWHMFGTLLITFTFPFIYSPPPGYDRASENWSEFQIFLFYIPFIVLFQIAWASAQVSHLSLIPFLTCKDSARVQLTSIRNVFTLLSSIAVFVVGRSLFLESPDNSELELDIPSDGLKPNCSWDKPPADQVSWSDRHVFKKLSLGAVALGFLFQGIIFHFFVPEENPCDEMECDDIEENQEEGCENSDLSRSQILGKVSLRSSALAIDDAGMEKSGESPTVDTWTKWMKEPLFFNVGLLYCLTRLIVNVTATYFPFYIQESLDLPKEFITSLPLINYLTGFVVSFAMKPLAKHLGKNVTFFLGCLIMIAGCMWAGLLENDPIENGGKVHWGVYFLPVIFGAGTSTILVQSLSITAALIGENTNTAAFVYGAMSLTDKIACGAAIMLIQTFAPCSEDQVPNGPCEDNGCGLYYCRVLAYIVGGFSVLAIFANLLHWNKVRKFSR